MEFSLKLKIDQVSHRELHTWANVITCKPIIFSHEKLSLLDSSFEDFYS